MESVNSCWGGGGGEAGKPGTGRMDGNIDAIKMAVRNEHADELDEKLLYRKTLFFFFF